MFERISVPRKPLVRARAVARQLRRQARAFWAVPANQERTKSSAVFAAIFALTLVGVDYVVTGGPDVSPGGVAYAMEIPQAAPRAEHVVRAGPLPPTRLEQEDAAALAEPVDYSFTTEVLLGGPDTVLAAYEPFAGGVTRVGDKPDVQPGALEADDAVKSKAS